MPSILSITKVREYINIVANSPKFLPANLNVSIFLQIVIESLICSDNITKIKTAKSLKLKITQH